MSEHKATVRWKLQEEGAAFFKGRYSREHTWTFDGGVTVPASSSPTAVPAPYSNPAHVDPEEAYVAAISSCHMLTFLYVAMRQGFLVESYEDDAVGVTRKNDRGAIWVSGVTLSPRIVYAGDKRPSAADIEQMHHLAHEQCFISNSVKTEIVVKPQEP
jgi:organic hydroperoxide reductase OsmC/OhrA